MAESQEEVRYHKMMSICLEGNLQKKKDGTISVASQSDGEKTKTGGALSSPSVDTGDFTKDKLDELILDEYFKEIGRPSPIKKIKELEKMKAEKVPLQDAAAQLGMLYSVEDKDWNKQQKITFNTDDAALVNQAKTDLANTYQRRAVTAITNQISLLAGQYSASDPNVNASINKQIASLNKFKALYFPSKIYTKEDAKQSLDELTKMFGIESLSSFREQQASQIYRDNAPYPAPKGYMPIADRIASIGGQIKNNITDWETDKTDIVGDHSAMVAARQIAKMSADVVRQSESNIAKEAGVSFGKHFGDILDMETSIKSNRTTSKAIDNINAKIDKIASGEMKIEDLSASELALAQSLETLGKIQQTYGGEISTGIKVGSALGTSAAFMLEMYATGGVGGGVKAAATESVLAGSKTLAPSVMRAAAAETAGRLAQAGVQTLAMPSFFKNMSESYAAGLTMPEAVIDGYYNTYKEVASEALFQTKASRLANDIVNQSAIRKFFYRTNSALGNVYDVKSGLTAFGEEFTEEVFAGVVDGYKKGIEQTGNPYELSGVKDYLTNSEDLLLTAYSVGLMSAIGGGANIASNTKMKIANKAYGKKLGDLQADIDEMVSPTADGVVRPKAAELVNNVTVFAAEHAKINGLDAAEAIDFVTSAHKYAINKIALDEISEPKLSKATPVLSSGEITDKERTDGVEVIERPVNSYTVTLTEETEEIKLGNRLATVIDNITFGKETHASELDFARAELIQMKEESINPANKKLIQEQIDIIEGILTDDNPEEINTRPRVSITKKEPIIAQENSKPFLIASSAISELYGTLK